MERPGPSNFIRQIVDEDLAAGRHTGVVTRFPPEPNGYLHIGHAKAICISFGLARDYGGRCHLRFDDTNPEKEDQEYVDAIEEDIRWLGFDWGEHRYFASDYFPQLYAWAQLLVEHGKAYVDEQTEEQIRLNRGTVETPGKGSPWRDRPAAESLALLDRMRRGEFADGFAVLRAKIDMAHPNMKMRDPLMYRIRNVPHHHAGSGWAIYPFYDYAHGLSDAIEGITHSLCSLEFDNNRALYDWFVENLPVPSRPHQYEFARLNLGGALMSKRHLLSLVNDRHVWGWDDPRMPTLRGYRRRGVTAAAVRDFAERVGVSKAANLVDPALLDDCIRDDLDGASPRMLAVLDPLEVVIGGVDAAEVVDAPLWPKEMGRPETRPVPFSRRVFVDRDDWRDEPPEGWHRLAPGAVVRLRHARVIRVVDVERDDTGRAVRIVAVAEATGRGARTPDGRRVAGTVHWVDADAAVTVTVRLFDRLFLTDQPGSTGDLLSELNPRSLRVVEAHAEPAVAALPSGSHVQLERVGFFYVDPVDSRPGAPVLHRVVALKDTFGRRLASEAAPTPPPVSASTSTERTPPPPRAPSPHDPARMAALDALGVSLGDAALLAEDERWVELVRVAGGGEGVGHVCAQLIRPVAGAAAVLPPHVAALSAMLADGRLTTALARRVVTAMVETGKAPDTIVAEQGLVVMADEAALTAEVAAVLAEHATKVAEYRGGKIGLLGFFVGQVMKRTAGRAVAARVNELVRQALEG